MTKPHMAITASGVRAADATSDLPDFLDFTHTTLGRLTTHLYSLSIAIQLLIIPYVLFVKVDPELSGRHRPVHV